MHSLHSPATSGGSLALQRRNRAFSPAFHAPTSSTCVVRDIAPVTRVVAGKAKLGETSLFGGDSSASSLLGGAVMPPQEANKPKLEDVPLNSEVRLPHASERHASPLSCSMLQLGMDYTALRDHLQKGEYQKADDESRALLIKIAGADAVKRGWVYFSEVKSMPVADLQTMDTL